MGKRSPEESDSLDDGPDQPISKRFKPYERNPFIHRNASFNNCSNHGPVHSQASDTDRIPSDTGEHVNATAAKAREWKLPLEQVKQWKKVGLLKRIYCVRSGYEPGFYRTWEDTEKQVKGFWGNEHKSFGPSGKKSVLHDASDAQLGTTIKEAEAWMNANQSVNSRSCSASHTLANGSNPQPLSHTARNLNVSANHSSGNGERSNRMNGESGHSVGSSDTNKKKARKKNHLCLYCQSQPSEGEKLCPVCLASPDLRSRIEDVAEEFKLVSEQKELLKRAAYGKNVFITGAAGTGKSTAIKAIYSFFQKGGLNVAVVAPTGIAALGLDLNATTTYAYCGWTPNSNGEPIGALRIKAHGRRIWNRYDETDIIIIDEVSMVSSNMLTRISAVMEDAIDQGGRKKPFGGVQLVFTGDFYQLPAVKPFEYCGECGEKLVDKYYRSPTRVHNCFQSRSCNCEGHPACHQLEAPDTEKWAFMSPVWERCDFVNIELLEVHRQADAFFSGILNRVRKGESLTLEQRNALEGQRTGINHEKAVKLFPYKYQVKAENDDHMRKLTSTPHKFRAVDDIQKPLATECTDPELLAETRGSLLGRLKEHRYEGDLLELKEGMKVMLLRNLDLKNGLANGSIGKIIDFTTDLPSLDDQSRPQQHKEYATYQMTNFREEAKGKPWPVVKFSNGLTRAIYPDVSISEVGQKAPFALISRTQFPLMAGWAMTIHKSQGMTLACDVVIEAEKCFKPGHAYVALSRVKELSRMQLIGGLGGNVIRADQTVKAWMEETFGT